jgi:hypothetical protein
MIWAKMFTFSAARLSGPVFLIGAAPECRRDPLRWDYGT